MDIVRWEKLMPFSTWSSPWIISKAFSYGNVDSEVFTQQKSNRIKSASLLGHRFHVLCTVISLAIVCPCPHSTAPCLVPHCFRMTPLLLQLVGTLCVSWVNGLSEQNYFLKFQLHFKYLLRLWLNLDALKKAILTTALTHSATHTSLKSMRNVLQKSLFTVPCPPLCACHSNLYWVNGEGETFKHFSFTHQLWLEVL